MIPRDHLILCPACSQPLDSAYHAHNSEMKPSPGDPTICWGCGTLLVFDRNQLRPRVPTDKEQAALEHEESWPLLLRLIQRIKGRQQ